MLHVIGRTCALPGLLLLATVGCGTGGVMTGADRLMEQGWTEATGLTARRLGVVTNHTARLADGTHLVDALLEAGLEVGAIFSPEHGFEGSAPEGARIYSVGETYRGIPIHSLYGTETRPSADQLAGLGGLLFDIQDVGARFYTYTSTMARTMQAAAEAGLPYIVLDRPNPIGGDRIDGPLLEPPHISFVGLFAVPIRHGLTVGEYARWMLAAGQVPESLDLRVVPLAGWRRSMLYEETGLPWIAPSPNMPTPATALVYPGTCLIEGTNVSEGRGTVHPFEWIGAPWADGGRVAHELNEIALPGVRFHPVHFSPRAEGSLVVKWKDHSCSGVRLEVTDPAIFTPVRTGVEVVAAFRRLYPDDFAWRERHFDRLAGVGWLREGIEQGLPGSELEARWLREIEAWREGLAPVLLYR